MRPELPTAANVQAEYEQPARRRGQLCISTTHPRSHLNIGDCCSNKRGRCCALIADFDSVYIRTAERDFGTFHAIRYVPQ